MLAVCEHERAVVRVGNYIVFACREVLAAGVFAVLFPLWLFDRGSGGVAFSFLFLTFLFSFPEKTLRDNSVRSISN